MIAIGFLIILSILFFQTTPISCLSRSLSTHRSRIDRISLPFRVSNCSPHYSQSKSIHMSSSDNPPIQVTKQASPDVLQRLGVKSWPTWGCGVSEFPWSYSDTETSYIIKGKVIVTPSPSNGKVCIAL